MLSWIEASFFSLCVFRAQESWTWREEWSNPWSEESSRTAGQTWFPPIPWILLILMLILFLPSVWISSPHGLNLSHQVSGYFSRQNRADSSSQHRVQRQLWVFAHHFLPLHSPHCVSDTVNSWKLLNPFSSRRNVLDRQTWPDCAGSSAAQ